MLVCYFHMRKKISNLSEIGGEHSGDLFFFFFSW